MYTREVDCQDASVKSASRGIPRLCVLAGRAEEHFRFHGLISTLERIAAFLKRNISQLFNRATPEVIEPAVLRGDILDLQPGELVEVRSEQEIRKTLDASERHRGLLFMANMTECCGKQFRVYKRAQTVILEGSGEVRRLKNTVLLDGAICHGKGFVCDRSCFFFWREAWLKRVSAGSSSQDRVPNAQEFRG